MSYYAYGDDCDEALTGNGSDYRGCQKTTVSGYTCQEWSAQKPHTHSRTPSNYPNGGLTEEKWGEDIPHNYCRNPDGSDTIWCYVANPNPDNRPRWEYCVPKDQKYKKVVCNENQSGNGSDYRGCQNITISGATCQNWEVKTPISHGVSNSSYPNKGIGNHNFCRNPTGKDPAIWCYTEDAPNGRWEYCNPTTYKRVGMSECHGGKELKMYEGDGDNPGTSWYERVQACADACLTKRTPVSGSWGGFGDAEGFIVTDFDSYKGRCFCEDKHSTDSACKLTYSNAYHRYDFT